MTTTVQPATAALEVPPPRRIAPALIKGTKVLIECEAWCTVDHVAANENSIEDIWHAGEYADLKVPRMSGTPELLAFARLGVDEQSDEPGMQKPFVFVDDGSAGFYMTPEQAADEFAANLEAFAAQVRAMAKTAKEGQR
ncbi:DUF6907 domain-containing protein [Streptomyces sp.]|uniref:DUF6907 domain-containing protein n=1 Tax=Streptomyces sp. TaxID=1931 RepID=UPI002F93EE34